MFRPRLRPIGVGDPNSGNAYIRKDIRFDKSADAPVKNSFSPEAGGMGTANYKIDGKNIVIKFTDSNNDAKFDPNDKITEMTVDGKKVTDFNDITKMKIINRNNFDVQADKAEKLQIQSNRLDELAKRTDDVSDVLIEGNVDSGGKQNVEIKGLGIKCKLNVAMDNSRTIESVTINGQSFTMSPGIAYNGLSSIIEHAQPKLEMLQKQAEQEMDKLDAQYDKFGD